MAHKDDTPAARRKQHTELIERFFRAYEFVKHAHNRHQGPYTAELFEIFADAYINNFSGSKVITRGSRATKRPRWKIGPRIDGHELWQEALKRGLVTPTMRASNPAYAIIQERCQWWDAWTYAWDKNPPPQRKRKPTK